MAPALYSNLSIYVIGVSLFIFRNLNYLRIWTTVLKMYLPPGYLLGSVLHLYIVKP